LVSFSILSFMPVSYALQRMLCLDPNRRISAESALRHAYFDDLDPVYPLLLS